MEKIRISIYDLIKEFFTGDISNIRDIVIKNKLYDEGFSSAKITEILENLTNEGLIKIKDDSIYITNEGKRVIIGDFHINNARILINDLFENFGNIIDEKIIFNRLNKGDIITSSDDVYQILNEMQKNNLIVVSNDGQVNRYKKI